MTKAPPPDLIDAISRLNTHARAWGFGKKAIYAYKTLVACAFATEAKPVFVQVKCHHCDGTGQYRDYDGYHRGPCYRCANGIVTLRFVESMVNDCRWHHPCGPNDSGSAVLNAVWGITSVLYPESGSGYPHGLATLLDGTERPIVYVPADGWGPNLPGAEKLPADEACRLLNLVEDWIKAATPCDRTKWVLRRAVEEMHGGYRVELDCVDDGRCCACGGSDVLESRFGGQGSKWNGGWTVYFRQMCAACHGPNDALRWPQEPHPHMLTPHVIAWLYRRLPASYAPREDWR